MNFFELNKIIAAIILTIVIILGINKSSDYIYKADPSKTVALKVEVKEENISSTSEVQTSDIKAILAMGNFDHGKKIFTQCKACHSIKKDGGNKIGPALWSVLGRPIGDVNDYKYSKAFLGFGGDWNFETMNLFLIKPKNYIKGTKMSYAGLKSEKDRASVIIYLNQNSDSPIELP